LGVLGWTTPEKVRTERTIGDYSPALGPPVPAKPKPRTPNEFFSHHETSLVQSQTVPCCPPPIP